MLPLFFLVLLLLFVPLPCPFSPRMLLCSDPASPKKCRARFGLNQQTDWCGPCRCVSASPPRCWVFLGQGFSSTCPPAAIQVSCCSHPGTRQGWAVLWASSGVLCAARTGCTLGFLTLPGQCWFSAAHIPQLVDFLGLKTFNSRMETSVILT